MSDTVLLALAEAVSQLSTGPKGCRLCLRSRFHEPECPIAIIYAALEAQAKHGDTP